MAGKMNDCPWEPIKGFRDYAEFQRFCAWMRDTVAEGKAEKIPVVSPYRGIKSLTEEWYRHIESQIIWRLIWPDPPFKGLFERVE
jgi:hypothetical protein